jgi:osomolarity two-component system, sensor histidine kinase NIK1
MAQMDVSMPFMGGMEATELIRAYEMHNNLPPIPIIALTAHASAYPILFMREMTFGFVTFRHLLVIGDRERCIDAGMVRPVFFFPFGVLITVM